MDSECRLCGKSDETINHILASCEEVSSSLYLTCRHNRMGKVIYDAILKEEEECKIPWKVPDITIAGKKEIWWDKAFILPNKVKHNKPDLVVWNKETLECKIIDFSVPLDKNVSSKDTEKVNKYMPLISELQQLYRNYRYEIIPIVVGTLGAIPKSLKSHLKNIGLHTSVEDTIKKIQLAALTGTVKTMKIFLRMKKYLREF